MERPRARMASNSWLLVFITPSIARYVSSALSGENPAVAAFLNQFFNRLRVNAAQHWQAGY